MICNSRAIRKKLSCNSICYSHDTQVTIQLWPSPNRPRTSKTNNFIIQKDVTWDCKGRPSWCTRNLFMWSQTVEARNPGWSGPTRKDRYLVDMTVEVSCWITSTMVYWTNEHEAITASIKQLVYRGGKCAMPCNPSPAMPTNTRHTWPWAFSLGSLLPKSGITQTE
jgi:hypothetical protein